jgi:hypothetical protein
LHDAVPAAPEPDVAPPSPLPNKDSTFGLGSADNSRPPSAETVADAQPEVLDVRRTLTAERNTERTVAAQSSA